MPKFISALGFVLMWFLFPIYSHAQTDISLGIAHDLPILGNNVLDGHIISLHDKGYILSNAAYDASVVGVVAIKPALALQGQNPEKGIFPVAASGNVEIRVSTTNGNVKKGDLITTSGIPGVGMKATKSGYILGTALQDFSGNKNEIGLMPVSLNLRYSNNASRIPSNLRDILSLSALATYESPSAVFKYVVAGAIIVLSSLLGFISFGRAANTGVEALGRNPLAGKMIQMGIVFNVLITVAIVGAGFGLAYVIIRL